MDLNSLDDSQLKALLENVKMNPQLKLISEDSVLRTKLYTNEDEFQTDEQESIETIVKADLKKKINLLEDAKKCKETEPYPRPAKDLKELATKFRLQLDYYKTQLRIKGCAVRSQFLFIKQHSSLHKDFTELKPILLKNMQVNKVHTGHYLECHVVSEPFFVVGVNLLVQDQSGDIENLLIYNHNAYDIDPLKYLPLGTRILIKEPFLKLNASYPNEFELRVDSPTDVKIIPPESDKSVDELIDQANALFQKADYKSAFVLYTEAVDKSNNTSARAFLNRSACDLKLDRNYLAFTDAQQAATLDKANAKAYFRMGKSAYQMRQYAKAKQFYEKCLSINKKLSEADVELKRTSQRLQEAKTGVYDFKSMLEQFLKKETLHFDVADYESSKIRVTDIPNKSKGVVAVEDIKKGTLLVVSKALSAYFKPKQAQTNYLIKVNFLRNSCDLDDGCTNCANIINKMQYDPELAKKVYSLYAGPDYDREDKGNPFVVDVARVEGIQKYNTFFIEKDLEFIEIDTKDIFNQESGFWYFPSYFNHSCLGNALRLFVGDVLIIFAKRDIKKGEEITVKYFSGDYSERVEAAKKTHNFTCECELCQLDSKDTHLNERREFIEDIKLKKLSSLSLVEAREDLEAMKNMYGERTELRTDLVLPLQNLAHKYRGIWDYGESAKLYEEVYNITKERSYLVAIDALKDAHKDYKLAGADEKCEWCVKTAAEYFGENTVFFERFWNHDPNKK